MDNVRTLFVDARSRQDDVEAQRWRASVRARLFDAKPDPVRVDRYTILDRLGSGGAGVVFAAWDPRLARRVAVKLLHGRGDPAARATLEREAKLLAQLNHPNVVAVYDVASHHGQPLLAMEYVDGPTVSRWARSEDRSWPEVVEVFAQAARGLAAAHRAGIVHGDFKPSNVLVGTDHAGAPAPGRRVRVSDFGIARLADDAGGPVVGTVMYSAPELLAGGRPDHASDAFAFFAALYETLFGEPAFVGHSTREMAEAIATGKRRTIPRGRVPRWLADLVTSGLDPDPHRRPSDLQRVAERLDRRGAPARRWVAALVLGGSSIAATLAVGTDAHADGCRDALTDVHAAWDGSTRARLAERFTTSERPGADETWTRVDAGLDAYVRDFAAATDEVCAIDRPAAEALQARLCLRWRQQDFVALTSALDADDPVVIDHAAMSLQALGVPAACVPLPDAPPTTTAPVPGGDPGRAMIQRSVSRARALLGVGRHDDAREQLERAAAWARDTGDPRLEAEVLLELGRERAHRLGISDDGPTEMTLRAAILAARGAGAPRVAASAELELADAHMRSARFDDARRWLDRATASLGAFGTELDALDPLYGGRVELMRGMLASFEGRDADAIVHIEDAIASLGRTPAGGPWLGRALNGFAELRFERGEYAEAEQLYLQALTVWTEALGSSHPYVADVHGNLGEARLLAGDAEGARTHFAEALRIRLTIFGRDSFVVAHTRAHLGDALREAGHRGAAQTVYRDALAAVARIRQELEVQREHGAKGRLAYYDIDMGLDQVEPWARRGLALLALGRGDAMGALEHARAAPRASLRPGRHPDLAARIDVLGLALHRAGHTGDALALLAQTEGELAEVFGPHSRKSAYVPHALGTILLDLGRLDAAEDALRRALSIREADGGATGHEYEQTQAALVRLDAARAVTPSREP